MSKIDEHYCLACHEQHEPYYDGHLFRNRCCGVPCGEEKACLKEIRKRLATPDHTAERGEL